MPRHEERFCKQYITGTVFLLATTLFVSSERTSGLYVNNGFGQTIAHRIATHKEKREVEYELLKLLGLPDRPKRIARSGLLVKRSAPKYLLNVYKNVLTYDLYGGTTSDHEKKSQFRLSNQDRRVIDRSDVIMSFAARNPHVGHETRNNRGRRIWFDVSEVPPGERIIAAELRLYRSFDVDRLHPSVVYTVAIYRVARTNEGDRVKHFVDSTNTTVDHEGWLTLNIGESLQHWVDHPDENRGLFLAVHRADRTDRFLQPDDIGIVGVLGVPDKQPFMVGFFETTATRKNLDDRQRRRSTDNLVDMDYRENRYLDPKVRKRAKACNLQNLYVSFKDLQWQDWIIAPEGYDAYYCSGECSFPLNSHMNATNHAVVQTLVHLMKPETVPKPCCVPTKLSPISVLYFLDDSNVVLKKYKNMVVTSCGCH